MKTSCCFADSPVPVGPVPVLIPVELTDPLDVTPPSCVVDSVSLTTTTEVEEGVAGVVEVTEGVLALVVGGVTAATEEVRPAVVVVGITAAEVVVGVTGAAEVVGTAADVGVRGEAYRTSNETSSISHADVGQVRTDVLLNTSNGSGALTLVVSSSVSSSPPIGINCLSWTQSCSPLACISCLTARRARTPS